MFCRKDTWCEEERARNHRRPREGRASAPVLFLLAFILAASLLPATPTFGFIDLNGDLQTGRNFDAQAIASDGGRRLTVTGAFVCPKRARNSPFQIEASVLQEATGAVFQGITFGRCKESSGTFVIEGEIKEGSPAFEGGRAQACGLAAISRRLPVIFVTNWCSFVNVVEE